MVRLGQRRGIGLAGGRPKRYVTAIDRATSTVVVGDEAELHVRELQVADLGWAGRGDEGAVMVQCSAHGVAEPAELRGDTVTWRAPHRTGAPGQSVVVFDPSNTYVL